MPNWGQGIKTNCNKSMPKAMYLDYPNAIQNQVADNN